MTSPDSLRVEALNLQRLARLGLLLSQHSTFSTLRQQSTKEPITSSFERKILDLENNIQVLLAELDVKDLNAFFVRYSKVLDELDQELEGLR